MRTRQILPFALVLLAIGGVACAALLGNGTILTFAGTAQSGGYSGDGFVTHNHAGQ